MCDIKWEDLTKNTPEALTLHLIVAKLYLSFVVLLLYRIALCRVDHLYPGTPT